MYIQVDIILWIYLQNVILLPYEYLIETDEYDIFKNAEINKSMYILSTKEIHKDISYTHYKLCKEYTYLHFTSFDNLLENLNTLLDNESYKKQLINKALPIIKLQKIETMMSNCAL